MSLPPTRLYNPLTDSALLPQIAQIHGACILHDQQLATFLPPLSQDKLLKYWTDIAQDVAADNTVIILQFADGTEKEIIGYVCLMMPESETGPFRGTVNKLMVSPDHRKKGVARQVMEALEAVARERERWLLMLDTTIELPAEKVYPKLGWTEIGVVPKYGISPKDGSLVDEKFFYKDLRDVKE